MAVDAFLRSVRSEDLQAMSAIWGDGQGLARERMDRATLERRELLMMCYFRHDKYRVQHEGPGPGGSRQLMVELARGNEWRSTTFSTVAGANRRWFVQEAQVGPLNDWCKKMP